MKKNLIISGILFLISLVMMGIAAIRPQVFAQINDSLPTPDRAQQKAQAELPDTDPLESVEAQDATGSGDPALDEQVRESMLERVKNVANRDQVRGALHDLLTQKSSFIGEVTRISEEAITVKSRDGSVIIPLSENVSIQQDGEELSVESIEIGNWATVLGNLIDTDVEPEFVLIEEEPLRPRNQQVIVGTIFELSRTTLTITSRENQEEKQFSIATTSTFQDSDGAEATWQDFEADMSILVIALEDEGDDDKGEFIISTVRALAPLSDVSGDGSDE